MHPIYAKNNDGFRICYCANGVWKLQERRSGTSSKTFDPWIDMSPPLTYIEALEILRRHAKETRK